MAFFSVYACPVWIAADVSNPSCALTEIFFPDLESYTSFFLQKRLASSGNTKLTEQEEKKKALPRASQFHYKNIDANFPCDFQSGLTRLT